MNDCHEVTAPNEDLQPTCVKLVNSPDHKFRCYAIKTVRLIGSAAIITSRVWLYPVPLCLERVHAYRLDIAGFKLN